MAAVHEADAIAGNNIALSCEFEGRRLRLAMTTYVRSNWRNAAFWWIQSAHAEPRARKSYKVLGMQRAYYDIYETQFEGLPVRMTRVDTTRGARRGTSNRKR
jgi:hypothetical protein